MWLKDTDKYLMDEAFSHSYPERMWQDTEQMGVRFNIADLNTAVKLLQKEPTTRQCYIPIWFPEDGTAALAGERVPCTFGWHYMLRDNKLHCSYHMRSCDVMRHLHNDLYFANRLAMWLIELADLDAKPGIMHFSATSLHCFQVDKYGLNNMVNE
jgi:thymidylate synthase